MAQETGGQESGKKIWMTLAGLPLTFRLEWPFHASTSGADFWVLHGDIRLENSEGLHAPVAVNLSQTVREVLPSLEPKDAEAPVINALRKEVDRRQIEFLKSGKLLPVAFSSRHYDFKRKQWVFGKASDEVVAEFVERKVFWETKLGESHPTKTALGGPSDEKSPLLAKDARSEAPARVWIGDPAEAQYLQTTPEHLLQVAAKVAGEGLLRIHGEYAEATQGLMNQEERFESARRAAVEELEKKHAFERA